MEITVIDPQEIIVLELDNFQKCQIKAKKIIEEDRGFILKKTKANGMNKPILSIQQVIKGVDDNLRSIIGTRVYYYASS